MRPAPLRSSWRWRKCDGFAPGDHMAVAMPGAAADAWSRSAPVLAQEAAFQLVERSGPALLVAAAALLVMQARMRECQLGPLVDGAKRDLDERFAGILDAAGPAPAHAQPLGLHDLKIFA